MHTVPAAAHAPLSEGNAATLPPWQKSLANLAVLCGAAFALSPWASPQTSLGLGVLLALLSLVPRDLPAQDLARFLIQVSVVLLGFRMHFSEVLRAGAGGMLFAALTIAATFALGELVRRRLRIDRPVSTLISAGTAICGGSAIAAVGATINASAAAMAVSMATVFLLNGVALYLFPALGHALDLTPTQFGAWAGVAIHDVSSVVGAAAQYDGSFPGSSTALQTATAVKLSRVLWIVPVCIVASWLVPRDTPAAQPAARRIKVQVPWFVLLFLVAAVLHTYIPEVQARAAQAESAARLQMRLALFLIGTGLSIPALRAVGVRPLIQGVILWVFISAAALAVVKATL